MPHPEEAPRGCGEVSREAAHKTRQALTGRKRLIANCENAEDDLSNGWRWSTGRILGAHASDSSHDKPWLLKIWRSEESRTRVSQVESQVRTTQTVRFDCLMLNAPRHPLLACLLRSDLPCPVLRLISLSLSLSLSVRPKESRQWARGREQVWLWPWKGRRKNFWQGRAGLWWCDWAEFL